MVMFDLSVRDSTSADASAGGPTRVTCEPDLYWWWTSLSYSGSRDALGESRRRSNNRTIMPFSFGIRLDERWNFVVSDGHVLGTSFSWTVRYPEFLNSGLDKLVAAKPCTSGYDQDNHFAQFTFCCSLGYQARSSCFILNLFAMHSLALGESFRDEQIMVHRDSVVTSPFIPCPSPVWGTTAAPSNRFTVSWWSVWLDQIGESINRSHQRAIRGVISEWSLYLLHRH